MGAYNYITRWTFHPDGTIVPQLGLSGVLQFGRVVQADVQPGLHVKVPYVNQVRKFDARLMTLDAPSTVKSLRPIKWL